jgi:hypothetical protein
VLVRAEFSSAVWARTFIGIAATLLFRRPDVSTSSPPVPRFSEATVILVASVVVMAGRHRLVLLGRVPPLGSRATRCGRLP